MSETASGWLQDRVRHLARENRIRPDTVPDCLGVIPVGPGEQRLIGEEYLLRTQSGLAFHYVRGAGIAVAVGADANPAEADLWLKGSVYCAVAVINGFVPIHASAVACGGSVFAFTGPSGAGKSTLIAALGREGLAMFCDDTLILELGDAERVWCLPGHKRLKLGAEALAATDALGQGPVGAGTGKAYAVPLAGTLADPLPLHQLYAIGTAERVETTELPGSGRLSQFNDGHYSSELLALARGFDRAQHFAFLAHLAARIPLARLGLPFDLSLLSQSASEVAGIIRISSRK